MRPPDPLLIHSQVAPLSTLWQVTRTYQIQCRYLFCIFIETSGLAEQDDRIILATNIHDNGYLRLYTNYGKCPRTMGQDIGRLILLSSMEQTRYSFVLFNLGKSLRTWKPCIFALK